MFLGTNRSNILNHMRFTNNNITDNNDDKEEKETHKKFNSQNPSHPLGCTSLYNVISPDV